MFVWKESGLVDQNGDYEFACYNKEIRPCGGVTLLCTTKSWNDESLIKLQFTGLKDKNGKEIYESDIVRILYTDWSSKSDSDPRTIEQYLIDISHVGQVVFNDNSWEVKKHSIKYNDFVFSSINHGKYGFIEVIGNIYENPELLS